MAGLLVAPKQPCSGAKAAALGLLAEMVHNGSSRVTTSKGICTPGIPGQGLAGDSIMRPALKLLALPTGRAK
jgi:hypothetical protein